MCNKNLLWYIHKIESDYTYVVLIVHCTQACNQLQLAIDPYKYDNARLVQECNQLHSDLIEIKETQQKQTKDLKKQIHKLECECNDLQLVSSRNIHKIKELEIESAAKSKKILELQGKCLKPTIVNVGFGIAIFLLCTMLCTICYR